MYLDINLIQSKLNPLTTFFKKDQAIQYCTMYIIHVYELLSKLSIKNKEFR